LWSNLPPVETVDIKDDYSLKSNKFLEPEKYYVEECDDIESDDLTPAQAELTRLKNLIEVKFNVPDKVGAEESVLVDKNMTLKTFREKIQSIVGLGYDDFKIKRGLPPSSYELVSESDTLSDCNIRDGMALVIEKGRPLKEGEITYSIFEFDLGKDSDHITELFELTIDENSLVADVKKVIAVKLREELQKRKNEEEKKKSNITVNGACVENDTVPVINPDHIRLRELSVTGLNSKRIGRALSNGQTLKKALVLSKRIAVQLLSEPEHVAENEICIFVQHFKPSTYDLTRKEDVIVKEGISAEELKPILAKKYNITVENVGLALVDGYFSFYDDPETLNIPKLNWDRSTKNYVSDCYIKSGCLVLVKDNTEELKVLTKEEQEAIEKETKKKAALSLQGGSTGGYFSNYGRKEKALKIHTAE